MARLSAGDNIIWINKATTFLKSHERNIQTIAAVARLIEDLMEHVC